VHEIPRDEILFYASVYVIAFGATVARTIRNPDGLNWRNTLSLGLTSGFLAFGMCCFLVDSAPDSAFSAWRCRGLAALLGLLAKEQDQITRWVWNKFVTPSQPMFESKKPPEQP
jgi:hypothetical protein